MLKLVGALVVTPIVVSLLLIERARVLRDAMSEFTAPYVEPDL
jgi:hypothetical protein